MGSECCRLFADKRWKVISVDNYIRGKLFGPEGDYIWWITNISKAKLHYPNRVVRIGLEEILKEIYEFLAGYDLGKR